MSKPTKNAGRSTDGSPKVLYYPGSAATEAARHLRLTVSRFLSDRASRSDVDEAIKYWQRTEDAAHESVE